MILSYTPPSMAQHGAETCGIAGGRVVRDMRASVNLVNFGARR